MSIVCFQCGANVDGDGIEHRTKVFCSDECCEEYEDELTTNGEPDLDELDEGEDFDADEFDEKDFEDKDFDEDEFGYDADGVDYEGGYDLRGGRGFHRGG